MFYPGFYPCELRWGKPKNYSCPCFLCLFRFCALEEMESSQEKLKQHDTNIMMVMMPSELKSPQLTCIFVGGTHWPVVRQFDNALKNLTNILCNKIIYSGATIEPYKPWGAKRIHDTSSGKGYRKTIKQPGLYQPVWTRKHPLTSADRTQNKFNPMKKKHT